MILNPRSQPAALRDPSFAPLRLPGVLGSAPSVRRPSTTRRTALYTVRKGDSPSSIAANAGVSVTELLQVNPTKPRMNVNGLPTFRTLNVGERINLPVARPRATGLGDPCDPTADDFDPATCAQQYLPASGDNTGANTGGGAPAPVQAGLSNTGQPCDAGGGQQGYIDANGYCVGYSGANTSTGDSNTGDTTSIQTGSGDGSAGGAQCGAAGLACAATGGTFTPDASGCSGTCSCPNGSLSVGGACQAATGQTLCFDGKLPDANGMCNPATGGGYGTPGGGGGTGGGTTKTGGGGSTIPAKTGGSTTPGTNSLSTPGASKTWMWIAGGLAAAAVIGGGGYAYMHMHKGPAKAGAKPGAKTPAKKSGKR
jgi:LysM repeat protein